ncbi:DUF1801 domain-containing protein [Chryseobacterium indoltheticum]|uniref:Uncharacterized conserved protein n=1 Tax=Chryseobacterium indoltheticum TaxID=254 RepID=A0A381FQH9_9FLAO|nr:DUF1801 domain-containing protein [Chryseobacterium indoltheticum]SUX48618.1 Uncharacterized conserved protein [Chryseobacterium indoltheticum]
MINNEITSYNNSQSENDAEICRKITFIIDENLREADSKIWHAHPVWFLEGNPIVGYSKQKKGIRLMFWSGRSFNEEQLNIEGDKFQDASVFYKNVNEINETDILRWLKKSVEIQWDYKNIVKRKGELIRLK